MLILQFREILIPIFQTTFSFNMATKTQEQLTAENTTNITTNGKREITGLKVRTLFQDIIDTIFSLYNTLATAISNIPTYTHPNHSGDVTSAGDGAQTIAANAVTNAKAAKMPSNSLKGNNTASTADAADIALSTQQVIGRLAGNIVPINLVTSSLTVGDFMGAYAGLAVEANWTNNYCLSATVAGASGDLHFGIGNNGTTYYAFYGQTGWNRVYSDNRVTDAALIAILQTSANWTSAMTYSVASETNRGDLGQIYVDGNFEYRCIDGVAHTWYRDIMLSNSITATDITFLPKPQIEVGKINADTFVIESKFDIESIRVVAETTTAGNISIGSAAGLSDIVAITALPTVIGTGLMLLYVANPNFPTSASRSLYVTISSAASVTFQIITQKKFA
jgi:hypothetical protein